MIIQKVKPKSTISFLSDEFIESLEEARFTIEESLNQEENSNSEKNCDKYTLFVKI